ncbi:S41 family peptidase [uncultured Cocleimonas sp.]|uniref:S41 family peptidase n=1 Tax=uncultured Cocleimonas sp. TaxID=1051587 RepID=UPI0026280E1C|nr:S41 family peptidase [uncultured Cocleimonas sp.]
MPLKKSLTTGAISGVFIGLAVSFSINAFALKPSSQTLPLAQLKKFSEVYARIKNDYVEEVDDKKLITDAISGMLSGLDPHSAYLDEEAFTELRVGTSGEFGGLGIEVGMENGFVKVIAPIDDTPAKKAGLKSGDLIIRLDDKSVKGLTLNDAVKLMRGKPGEAIELLITREGKSKPFKITIVRDVIKVKSVKKRILEKDYGYLRISSFQSKTTDNTKTAIEDLLKDNKNALKGLVLDLRDNPGGVLNGAVGVSDVFLRKGNIVYTEGRVDDALMRYNATPDDLLEGAPLVVLVNQGSASASEIVAGALQDHKRALIIGTKTFGKGSVQTVLPLDEKTGVKLTTARYFTPSGRSIQAKGIEPDITVEELEFKKKDENTEEDISPLSEADLSGHISNPNGEKKKPEASNNDAIDAKDKSEEKNLVETDFQLYEALNLLKSMNLIQEMNLKKG